MGCLVVPRIIFILISQPSFMGKPRRSAALLAGGGSGARCGIGARGKSGFRSGDENFYF
jgi:hypothetical protein